VTVGTFIIISAFIALWGLAALFGMINAYRMEQGKSDMTPWWPKNG